MSAIKAGGPALPIFIVTGGVNPEVVRDAIEKVQHLGMTVRDIFAMNEKSEPDEDFIRDYAASEFATYTGLEMPPMSPDQMMQMRAAWRYRCADAMLKERTL